MVDRTGALEDNLCQAMWEQNAGQDETSTRDAGAFRPYRKAVRFAVFANVALLVTFLIYPYVRGIQRTRSAMAAFADFAGCMVDATSTEDPGIGLPSGERDGFAHLVLAGPTDWPLRCGAALARITHPEATFLFPAVKQAEGDVRLAVERMQASLVQLDTRRGDVTQPIPTAPLEVLSRLRAALALLAKASDIGRSAERDAVRFEGTRPLVQPARVPLAAARDATLHWTAHGDGIEAVALDRTGVAWLATRDATLDRRRMRRPRLLRAVIPAERADGNAAPPDVGAGLGELWLVWAMPDARCTDDNNFCRHHATGIAPLPRRANRLPKPVWLQAHPAGAVEQSVRVTEAGIDVLARTARGLTLKRFSLPDTASAEATAEAEAKQPPEAPTHNVALGASGTEHYWFEHGVLVEATARSGEVSFRVNAGWPGQDAWHALGRVAGGEAGAAPWVVGCQQAGVRWFAYGTDQAAALARWEISDAPQTYPPLDIREPHAPTQLRCDGQRAALWLPRPEGELQAILCDGGSCTPARPIDARVAAFDAVWHEGAWLMAATSDVAKGAIRLQRITSDATTPLPVPAACWENAGLCGQPWLRADGDRLLLAARERSDALVLQSEDGGQSWQPLKSLQAVVP